MMKEINEVRRNRHDLRHNLQTLRALIKSEKTDEALEYLDTYIEHIEVENQRRFWQNEAVNAALNHYYARALQKKIQANVQVYLPSLGGISQQELCTVVGNILENCIDGCMTVAEEKRRLSFCMLVRGSNSLIITSDNTFDGEVKMEDGRYETTKLNGSGIGTVSVAKTAEKYGGTARFYHRENEFFTDIFIPVNISDDNK